MLRSLHFLLFFLILFSSFRGHDSLFQKVYKDHFFCEQSTNSSQIIDKSSADTSLSFERKANTYFIGIYLKKIHAAERRIHFLTIHIHKKVHHLKIRSGRSPPSQLT